MSQEDFAITTGDANTGATFRAAVNAALQALASCSSGATEPSVMYPGQIWADTGNTLLKMRNQANNAWITIGTLDAANFALLPLSGGVLTGPITGTYAPLLLSGGTLSGALVLPAGSAAAPSVTFGGSIAGFYEAAGNVIGVATSGNVRMLFSSSGLSANDANGPRIKNAPASGNDPTLVPNQTYVGSGMGMGAANEPSLIANSVEVARVVASGLTIPVAAASPPVANTLSKENIVKARVNFDETGSINDSYNVSSITDDGTGEWTVNWDRDFANTNYGAWGTAKPEDSGDGYMHIRKTGVYTVGAVTFQLRNSSGTLIDGTIMNVFAMGDQ